MLDVLDHAILDVWKTPCSTSGRPHDEVSSTPVTCGSAENTHSSVSCKVELSRNSDRSSFFLLHSRDLRADLHRRRMRLKSAERLVASQVLQAAGTDILGDSHGIRYAIVRSAVLSCMPSRFTYSPSCRIGLWVSDTFFAQKSPALHSREIAQPFCRRRCGHRAPTTPPL